MCHVQTKRRIYRCGKKPFMWAIMQIILMFTFYVYSLEITDHFSSFPTMSNFYPMFTRRPPVFWQERHFAAIFDALTLVTRTWKCICSNYNVLFLKIFNLFLEQNFLLMDKTSVLPNYQYLLHFTRFYFSFANLEAKNKTKTIDQTQLILLTTH